MRTALGLALVVACAAAACGSATSSTSPTAATSSTTTAPALLALDPGHSYGDRYAAGILPVGDGAYVTDGPRAGRVYLCRAGGPPNAGGAQVRGPWFSADGTTYDVARKVHVQGSVHWGSTYTMTVDATTRTITTNDLPRDHPTGVFPVAADDPASRVDRNPNTIRAQSVTYRLPVSPVIDAAPHCIGGQVGVMTTGVELFDAFDALLRDAGAWEVQDGCEGHPEITGSYHYHSLSSCITDTSVRTVIGFALDGLPITGPTLGPGNVLTTADLDECHGITSVVDLDGTEVRTYHYVMTQDFPYSVACFRAAPTRPPGPG